MRYAECMPLYECFEHSKLVRVVDARSARAAAQLFVDNDYWPDCWMDAEIWVREVGKDRQVKFLVRIPR